MTVDESPIRELISGAALPSVNVSRQNQLVATFQSLAGQYKSRAGRIDYIWARVVPRVATIVIGGGLVLWYAFRVIVPIYQRL